MTDLEPVLDSSNRCSIDMISEPSGAGANACSRNNMVLISAPPLYELVWSQHNGLSLKYASSSLAEEKPSLCWSAETFDIVISSQHCPYIGEENDAREFCVYELNSRLESHIKDKAFDRDTPVGSPRSNCGSSGDMAELERNDKVVQEKHEEDGDCYGQDVIKYPQINEFQLHDAKSETFFIQEKYFKSGPENCSASTEPSKLKDQISNHEVNPASYHRNSFECSIEFNEKDNCNAPCFDIPTYEDQVLANDATPINKSSASTPRPSVDGFSAMDATRRNKKGKVEPHRNQFCMVGTTPDRNTSASKMGKGKGKIISDADDSRSSSNMREDDLENIESASSSRIISTVKRVRIDDSESEKLIGSKRLKKLTNWTCSGTRKDSSFMNWVTNITNCLISPQDAHMESSQHYFQHKKVVLSPLSILDKKKEDTGIFHGTRGFGSIFTALYHPGYNVGIVENKNVDHLNALKETDGKKPCNGCALHERMALNPHSTFHASSFSIGEDNKEHISNGLVKFSTDGIASGEDAEVDHNKVMASSNRLYQDVCQVEKYPSATMDTCAELMTDNRHLFQKSLWLARLSRRVSSPEPRSLWGSNFLDLAAQKLLNDSLHNFPCLESQINRANEDPLPHSTSHTDYHGSERIVTDKLESKLHLIVSSQTFKRLEPMRSTFSRKLDALKQANPSGFSDKGPGASKICLFCGMSDHSIKECLEVVETKLEDYLKSISMYDSIKKASGFCILCLKLDHWAVECPNVSKGNQFLCNAYGFSDGNIKSTSEKKNGNHPSTTYDGAMIMCSGGRQDQHQFVHGSSAPQRFADLSNVSCHKKESVGRGRTDLCMNEVGGTTKSDKMEVEAFCSQENELKRSEFASFHNTLSTTIMNEPKGIFLAVRKLHLSRKDILRWMKSTPHLNVDGFYLRLRIGKREKGLGGTDYHVACINGACCKSFISVCVGSSTYSVSSRFISNHDFDEDELNAWWFKILREGSKMPTREELNEKLQLRFKFGF